MKNSKVSSWWLLRSEPVDPRRVWQVVLLSLTISGFAIRFIEIASDPLDYDEYITMQGIGQSLLTYIKGHRFGSHLLVHYWLSNRLLGDSLIAYRTMSLIASILLLLLTTLCLRHFWPSERGVCLLALLVIIFNANALYLTRYAMFSYGNSLLVSVGLFFLFMRLAEGPIQKRQWLLISVVILPVAFFTNITTIVPLGTGILLVIVFRWWRFTQSRNMVALWRSLWEMKSLIVFPITYLIRNIIFPRPILSVRELPDMASFYFTTCDCSNDFLGVMKFYLIGTLQLFWGILYPIGNVRFVQRLVVAIMCLLAGLTVVQVARRRADQRTVFTLFFLLTALAAVLGASLLGLYPYGRGRYVPYLLAPIAILIGFGGLVVYRWISQRLVLTKSLKKALYACSVVLVLIVCCYVSVERYNNITITRESNYQAINWLRTQKPDLILAGSYNKTLPVLAVRVPEVYERVHSMGRGTSWEEDAVPREFVDVITGVRQSQPVDSILVILTYKDIAKAFPRWNSLLSNYFSLDNCFDAPDIWVGLYRRKARDSAGAASLFQTMGPGR
jgi:hypothetical protein